MVDVRNLIYFILLHFIVATPQSNLYYTDWVSESESDNALQHDCLRVTASIEEADVSREIISYCMSELPSKFNVKKNDFLPNFTFAELSKQNITSQQLYLWSAPIDIVERYQFYLNQLSTSNDVSMAKAVFYNCTMPRFGSMCQYEIDYHHPDHSSLYEIIRDFYRTHHYKPTNLTCYTHIQCNRGPSPACLDWSEICNGQLDCFDGDFDEEHCWQLEINECKDNEYRCDNGQCIQQSFYQDYNKAPDCLDGSDENRPRFEKHDKCVTYEPSFGCEDITCTKQAFTSSCVKHRKLLLIQAMFYMKDNSISDICWSGIQCILHIPSLDDSFCGKLCKFDMCYGIIENECPNMLYIPAVPVLFNQIYYTFRQNDSRSVNKRGVWTFYLCYNNSHYDDYFINSSQVLFNNATCYRHSDIQLFLSGSFFWDESKSQNLFEQLWQYNQVSNYTSIVCDRSNIYQCASSIKCISIHRLMDGKPDCPHRDDENRIDTNKTVIVEDPTDIYSLYDKDTQVKLRYARKNILFQTICDGFTELSSVTIEGRNETDETECEQWQCNNIYTRCNHFWNCLNGADEVGCDLLPPLNCPSDHHICVSPHTNQFMCLPITKANDGKVDCLGATDEPTLCQTKYQVDFFDNFYCRNSTSPTCVFPRNLCNDHKDCAYGDDEQFCEKNRTFLIFGSICHAPELTSGSSVEQFICKNMKYKKKELIVYFSLDGMEKSVKDLMKNVENTVYSSSSIIQMSNQQQPRCHRGIDLRVWLNNGNNSTRRTCLCPPSFYGDICQYQNQRISMAIKFRALSDSWQTLFAIVISLIDDSDKRIIHSYEQFTYLSIRDCKIKFNIYLLYSTRPKHPTKQYAIHIDIYEKVSLTYRGSLLYPINFPFLPVHRLAFIVDIPRSDDHTQRCSYHRCVHGKCIRYSNNPHNATFCQCHKGWSGRYCTIPHSCTCSSDSLCIGVSANNRSICVCPIHRFGSRCLLFNTVCETKENSACQHGGQCIPIDETIESNRKFLCICSEGYIGDQCEIANNELILSFGKDIVLSQSIFIHFIEIINNGLPVIVTTFRTIPLKQDPVRIYWSRPFHLAFIELASKNYYLTVVQKTHNRSTTNVKMINPPDRCPHISEIFNETFAQWHLLNRIKYYHLPCERYSFNLSCFYDDVHICLCYDYDHKRLANCFEFNHNMTFDCLGQSACENGGQCFQDTPDCPQRSMCVCPSCFYGTRCQFSTSGFGLSLDAILGYHILPHISIIHQPPIVKISLALTIIFCMVGLINGVLCMITLNNKAVRQVGCGLYLLGSSITTLFTTILSGLKFCILVVAQMTVISNRSFLQIQCISLDFLLRVCINMDQCLNACMAIERAITVIKGTRFNKKKSKQAAKWVIIILLFVLIGTNIHDPIYRRLIEEENEDGKRIWCIVTYPSSLKTFNSVMDIFYFLVPFVINLISAVILITKKSRQQSNVQTHRSYKELLHEQFRRYKNLFIAPSLLVILALPSLIFSFAAKCMKSASDSWLFIAGYFISFIPPMLTFVIFILPSKFYKREFRKSLARYQTNIQTRLQRIS